MAANAIKLHKTNLLRNVCSYRLHLQLNIFPKLQFPNSSHLPLNLIITRLAIIPILTLNTFPNAGPRIWTTKTGGSQWLPLSVILIFLQIRVNQRQVNFAFSICDVIDRFFFRNCDCFTFGDVRIWNECLLKMHFKMNLIAS